MDQTGTPADAYLTSAELRALTGFCHRAKQQGWLKLWKWPFELSGDGRILVLRAYYLDRMYGRQEAAQPVTTFATRRHNFAALS